MLPTLPKRELDLFFIDGGHGFPTPMIDWYYGAWRLRRGGFVVIDDIHLSAVRLLLDYLDADLRWNAAERTGKWAAYERMSEGRLREEHSAQGFLKPPGKLALSPVEGGASDARLEGKPG